MVARHASSQVDALLISADFDGEISANEPMSSHTTYRIGGPARYYVRCDSVGAFTQLVEACEADGSPWLVMGKGSNLLVSDAGFAGVIITLGRDFKNFRTNEKTAEIVTGAAVLLSAVVQEAFRKSLQGLEFAVGTPGNIGGAVRMNAGSATEWIGALVQTVTTYTPGAGLRLRQGSEIEWGYRSTSFAKNETVLECQLALTQGDPFYIRGKMEANLRRRKENQPMQMPSCGSVFRNPEGQSAGALIDQAGLKGHQIGGAQISPTHANFIVNTGGATAADVCELISLARTQVYNKFGVMLTEEVRFVGF
jgi:UDP-N-acetylmuramate dehydrogenase